ncbi:MAG: penicillin-binding protein 1C [Flavobacteriales bacterium]|nr:penicillin-binding protein 1C [Flavobacteriales bacterium]
MQNSINHKTRERLAIGTIIVLLLLYVFILPSELFIDPTCSVIEDQDGNLIGARIAEDGQWRFPHNDVVPEKFRQCIIQFEDKNFYSHPGIDFLAICRATYQNLKAGHIVSGGSTLTMQVIRLSRKGQGRTFFEKFIEMIFATRLEMITPKEQILAYYSSNAPFGGNVVGLDAAAWRYYGRSPQHLSWAESATLAVLPNAPSLIFPGKNHQLLLAKRNRLLDKLLDQGIIDPMTCEISKEEPLPQKPLRLPNIAPHLHNLVIAQNKGKRIRTTIDRHLQEKCNEIIKNHHFQLKFNEIHNAAAIVIEVETGNILAYVGNTTDSKEHGNDVDVIQAPRSTGSILKPLLYASMLSDGDLLPNTLVDDIPTKIAGYSPKNYNLKYSGVVPASKALSRSLNVPIIRMLQNYGLQKFHHRLQKLNLSTINKPADHYGLTIILGGAESSLWDITNVFTNFSRTLNHFERYNGQYNLHDYRTHNYLADAELPEEKLEDFNNISAASIYLTYKALVEVNRPDNEVNWKYFSGNQKIAWKTGTSFGFRDAWAVGTTPDYVVGVWVGNADGEGRPGLTGINSAAPILFDIFDLLPNDNWFPLPFDELAKVPICRKSGMRAGENCEPVDSVYVQKSGLKTAPCKYHQLIHTDQSGYRVNSNCEDVENMLHKKYFVLQPVQEWYYKSTDPTYIKLPPYRSDCQDLESKPLQLIYPEHNALIYIPLEISGKKGKVVFEAAHRKQSTTLFWHVDNSYVGSTKGIHEMGLNIEAGEHLLTVVDEMGNSITRKFTIVDQGE